MPRPRLTYANVTSSIALFLALGGTSYAVAKLPKNSVGDRQLKPGAVTTTKVAGGAITAEKLADGVAITGPRGPRGAEGPQGPAGATGPAGAVRAEGWQALAFQNDWTNFGYEYETGGFRKDGAGNVQLRGVIKHAGDLTSGLVIATLPAGYRPGRSEVFSPNGGGLSVHTRVDVRANGEVVWQDGSSTSGSYVSLSGISFSPAG